MQVICLRQSDISSRRVHMRSQMISSNAKRGLIGGKLLICLAATYFMVHSEDFKDISLTLEASMLPLSFYAAILCCHDPQLCIFDLSICIS